MRVKINYHNSISIYVLPVKSLCSRFSTRRFKRFPIDIGIAPGINGDDIEELALNEQSEINQVLLTNDAISIEIQIFQRGQIPQTLRELYLMHHKYSK